MISKNIKNLVSIKKYINHNKKNFLKSKKSESIFLVEFNRWQGIHIAFSYLTNVIKNKFNCKIYAFESYSLLNRDKENLLDKLKWSLGKYFNLKNFGVYSSFGTEKFIKPIYNLEIKNKSKKVFDKFYSKNKSLKKLENLKVEKIWIGDLIYDSYLIKYATYTIDLDSKNFKDFFLNSLYNFYYWNNFFKKNKVVGVAVCHSVYLTGIPLRIANYLNLLNYCFSGANIYNLKNRISYKERINGTDIGYKYFRSFFKKFNLKQKKIFLRIGRSNLSQLILGKKKYYYMQKNSFRNSVKKFNFKKNIKKKIVIYSHLFSDSPHIYGNHFFSDFYEWFKFLKKIIAKTNYDWYIKSHPSEDKTTKEVVDNFVKTTPQVKKISKVISNSVFKTEKIDYALTIFGTVASELPFYGVKVINASKNNPHYDYNFSINPKNLNEYKNLLLNLDKNKFIINHDDLYEYHFMKNYFSFSDNILFRDINQLFKFKNNRQIFLTPDCYEIWLKKFSIKKHKKILKTVENFVNSSDYTIMKSHEKTLNNCSSTINN